MADRPDKPDRKKREDPQYNQFQTWLLQSLGSMGLIPQHQVPKGDPGQLSPGGAYGPAPTAGAGNETPPATSIQGAMQSALNNPALTSTIPTGPYDSYSRAATPTPPPNDPGYVNTINPTTWALPPTDQPAAPGLSTGSQPTAGGNGDTLRYVYNDQTGQYGYIDNGTFRPYNYYGRNYTLNTPYTYNSGIGEFYKNPRGGQVGNMPVYNWQPNMIYYTGGTNQNSMLSGWRSGNPLYSGGPTQRNQEMRTQLANGVPTWMRELPNKPPWLDRLISTVDRKAQAAAANSAPKSPSDGGGGGIAVGPNGEVTRGASIAQNLVSWRMP